MNQPLSIRRATSTLLALGGMALLAGCPQDNAAPAPATPDAAPAAAAPETTPAAPAAAQSADGAQPRYIQLEVAGLRLGTSFEDTSAFIRAGSDPLIRSIWHDSKGQNGVMQVRPRSGAPLPADDYCIVDGVCVGYLKCFETTLDDYLIMVREMAGLFDPAAVEPPAWAADDSLVKSLPALEGVDQRIFWDDRARGELLIVQRDDPSGDTFVALYRPVPCSDFALDYAEVSRPFSAETTAPAPDK